MATLNLGRLKPVFRSTWNSATAYNVDDIVVRNNQSYISIQAGTNQDPATATAYWTLMAAKGADGDNFGLANKEIAFKTNAGALDGIPMGNAGEFLKINSGATGYEFGAAGGGKVLQYSNTFLSGQYSNSSASFGDFSGLPEFSITPTATSSKILIMSDWSLACENWNVLRFVTKTGSGSYGAFLEPTGATGSQLSGHFSGAYTYGDGNTSLSVSCSLLHSPNTTQQVSYKLQGCSHNPNTIYINRTSAMANYEETGVRTSNIMLMELAG